MPDSFHISTILARIAKLEEVSQELYGFYADVFEDHPDGAKIFTQMKQEEKTHKNEALFQKRIVDKNPADFGRYEIDLTELENLIDEVDAQIQKGVFDIEEAVDFAIKLEKNAIEVHYRTWASKLSPVLDRLSRILKNGDEQHVQKLFYLKEFIQRNR